MTNHREPVYLYLSSEQADSDYVFQLTRDLMDEIKASGEVTKVAMLQDENVSKEGTKSGELVAVGAILLEVANIASLLPISEIVQSWVNRDKGRSIRLKIGDNEVELSNISQKEQKELLQWFQKQVK